MQDLLAHWHPPLRRLGTRRDGVAGPPGPTGDHTALAGRTPGGGTSSQLTEGATGVIRFDAAHGAVHNQPICSRFVGDRGSVRASTASCTGRRPDAAAMPQCQQCDADRAGDVQHAPCVSKLTLEHMDYEALRPVRDEQEFEVGRVPIVAHRSRGGEGSTSDSSSHAERRATASAFTLFDGSRSHGR